MVSRAFLECPPPGFAEQPLLTPRGALLVATQGQETLLQQTWQALRTISDRIEFLGAPQACAMVPVLRPERVVGAVYDPGAAEVDVDALHQGYRNDYPEHSLSDPHLGRFAFLRRRWRPRWRL